MEDLGNKWTEEELAALERKIKKIFKGASKDLQKKADEYFSKLATRDKQQQDLLKAGKITEEQYKQWRLAQIGRGDRFIALRDACAERMTEANKVAVAYVNDITPSIMSLNYNYSAYTIEQVSGDVGFTLWDEQTVKRLVKDDPTLLPKRRVNAPKDLKWNKKRFTAEITAGILLGEPIGTIANRVQNLSDANRSGAIRNARTAVTGAQNAGRQASYDRAKEMGLQLRKRWIATKDNRTRHAHAMLDGQTVPLDKPFKIDGADLMFPGDPTGRADLVWNCRCTMRTVEKEGIEAEPRQMRVRNPETGRNELVSEMTYAEWTGWKQAKEKMSVSETTELAELRRKYKTLSNAMLFGEPEEMVRFSELLAKEKASAGEYDFDVLFAHQNTAESKLYSWQKEPDKATADALGMYSRSGYVEINEHLRHGALARDTTKEQIKALGNYLQSCSTQEDLYLKRGISASNIGKVIGNNLLGGGVDSAIGQVFTDKAFVSTTPYDGGGFGGNIVAYIKAPAGTQGAYIKKYAAAENEKEFLLNKGQSFIIRNIKVETDKWGDEKYTLFLEVVV